MRSQDDRIDLSTLDPEHDPDRVDRVVRGVMDRIGPGIVPDEPSMVQEVERLLARRSRIISAAAVMLIIAASLLRATGVGQRDGRIAQEIDGLSLPTEWGSWIQTGQAPSTEALLLTLITEEMGR